MYQHNFGSFKENITVDGEVYTFEDYKELPHEERIALREEAVNRCVQANRRRTEAWQKLIAPAQEEYRRQVSELEKLPRYQKRYRGRAADMRYEENRLRSERDRKIRELRGQLESVHGNTYPAAVHDVFFVWEQKVETPWEKFERMVTHHDWYFEYSDDHSVWSAGVARRNTITALMKQLGPDAVALYNKCCPWLNDDGTRKET